MPQRGRFITVEGIEGVGKSSNVAYLADLICDRGLDVVTTREPGGTPMAERIRALLLEHGNETVPDTAELLLFFAARSLHLHNLILPAIDAGSWVICDRFTDASRAYQGGGRGLDAEKIETLAAWVQDGLQPDLTLLLDAPASVGLGRVRERGVADRMDSEARSFYERVRAVYLELAKAAPERIVIIDAAGSLESVQAQISDAVSGLFDN